MGHAYNKGWDTKPKLDEARVIAPETPGHRARKDRRRWCRGKIGVEHAPEIKWSKFHTYWMARGRPDLAACHWVVTYTMQGLGADRHPVPADRHWWSCHHERVCTSCGKILNRSLSTSCPDYTESGRNRN